MLKSNAAETRSTSEQPAPTSFWTASRRRKLNIALILFAIIEIAVPLYLKFSSQMSVPAPANQEIAKEIQPPAQSLPQLQTAEQAAQPSPELTAQIVEQPSDANTASMVAAPADALDVAPSKILPARAKRIAVRAREKDGSSDDSGNLEYFDPKTDGPDSLEQALGPEAIAATDELIAENEGKIRPDQISLAREIGISDKQFLEVKRRESILRKEMKRADRAGADAFKKLLLNDHHVWMREYLGHDKAEKYKELTQEN